MTPTPSLRQRQFIAIRTLCPGLSLEERRAIEYGLLKFPAHILELCIRAQIRIQPLAEGQSYMDASPALRKKALDVDNFGLLIAGLFVIDDRVVYLRSIDELTITHEFGHAIDYALGDGAAYQSTNDLQIQKAFESARQMISPYTYSLDEFFAECIRAFVSGNSPKSPWPRVSPKRLQRLHPAMFEYLTTLFSHDFNRDIRSAA